MVIKRLFEKVINAYVELKKIEFSSQEEQDEFLDFLYTQYVNYGLGELCLTEFILAAYSEYSHNMQDLESEANKILEQLENELRLIDNE